MFFDVGMLSTAGHTVWIVSGDSVIEQGNICAFVFVFLN